MKALIKQLDEKNEEIADVFISLGMSRPIARILSYLKNGNEITLVSLKEKQDFVNLKSVLQQRN